MNPVTLPDVTVTVKYPASIPFPDGGLQPAGIDISSVPNPAEDQFDSPAV